MENVRVSSSSGHHENMDLKGQRNLYKQQETLGNDVLLNLHDLHKDLEYK